MLTIPLNNFRHYWVLADRKDEFPLELGGNCIHHVDTLQTELDQEVEFLRVRNGFHVAALIDGKFLDTCFLQKEPLSIDLDFSTSKLLTLGEGRVHVSRLKVNCLHVEWLYQQPNGQLQTTVFDFDILSPFSNSPDLRLLELQKRTSEIFYLRFLDVNSGFLRVFCLDRIRGDFYWTYNIFPKKAFRNPVDSEFALALQNSLGVSVDFVQQCMLESSELAFDFWDFQS